MPDQSLYVGLMSGTSVDGVDAVVACFPDNGAPTLVAHHVLAPPPALRTQLLAMSSADTRITLAQYGTLNQAVGAWFADAANQVVDQAGISRDDVAAIGSHGQTVWHAPNDAVAPYSLQIGSPSLIAARTGIDVVADFRNSDMAVGGQGAPLVCAFHHAMFARVDRPVAVVNIGGIANVTFLPPYPVDGLYTVTGFDSGPGNGLMDAWIVESLDQRMDADGAWAASGKIIPELLTRLKADAYFHRPAPKSTGREYFGIDWLKAAEPESWPAPDVQATLCELSAQTIADAINDYGRGDEDVLLCGGGVHNRYLCERISACLGKQTVSRTDDFGVHADWVEAMAFAWLARQRLARHPGNAPGVTGARQGVVLGGLYLSPDR
ncbi:MAG: anhydro-N-acetylmuramic acid kinase [Salinisphaera sp.]|jgi:anhydro-N-acetylmuramic acid kinase|nr:anhydro-N-acetylmuramic acid kinase [Salinisphaera sp.]